MPPRRRAAGVLPQLLLSPCWIKKEETSPGCTCVERGGAVRSALDRIFRDLNRREYDFINRVLVTLPLSDLQGYEDALPLSLSLLASPRLILVTRRKILNYCYVTRHLAPCRSGPSSPVAMEEDPGGAIIVMKTKDQRENLSPSRGRPWRRKHKGVNLSPSLLVALECHRGNHRRGDRLHQHHHHHHHPHLFYAVHSPAPRCNPYLNMVLYATYYDPMMCCHPMMF